jgi:hypothetical protein
MLLWWVLLWRVHWVQQQCVLGRTAVGLWIVICWALVALYAAPSRVGCTKLGGCVVRLQITVHPCPAVRKGGVLLFGVVAVGCALPTSCLQCFSCNMLQSDQSTNTYTALLAYKLADRQCWHNILTKKTIADTPCRPTTPQHA